LLFPVIPTSAVGQVVRFQRITSSPQYDKIGIYQTPSGTSITYNGVNYNSANTVGNASPDAGAFTGLDLRNGMYMYLGASSSYTILPFLPNTSSGSILYLSTLDATVTGNASIAGNTTISGTANITGNTTLGNTSISALTSTSISATTSLTSPAVNSTNLYYTYFSPSFQSINSNSGNQTVNIFNGNNVWIGGTSAVTLKLYGSPVDGDCLYFRKVSSTSFAVTLDPNGSSMVNANNVTVTTFTMGAGVLEVRVFYRNANNTWYVSNY
jgi:hypothetical protein